MLYKIKIDRELCIGASSCAAVAPQTFELDTEGKAVIKQKDGSQSSDWTSEKDVADTRGNLVLAAKSCPVDAITIVEVDENGKEIKQIWPLSV